MTAIVGTPGKLAEHVRSHEKGDGIQAYRGVLMNGLKIRPLATGTIEVTGGDDGTDTFDPRVGGVSLVTAPVGWDTSHTATAAAIAVAINANFAAHSFVAYSGDAIVTIMQRTSGAVGALTCAVVGDATANVVDFSIDTDSYTTFNGGTEFDGDLYYELFFDPTLADSGVSGLDDALLISLTLKPVEETFAYWPGGLRALADASALADGLPVAADAIELIEWMGADIPLIIKLAADAVLHVKLKYI